MRVGVSAYGWLAQREMLTDPGQYILSTAEFDVLQQRGVGTVF